MRFGEIFYLRLKSLQRMHIFVALLTMMIRLEEVKKQELLLVQLLRSLKNT